MDRFGVALVSSSFIALMIFGGSSYGDSNSLDEESIRKRFKNNYYVEVDGAAKASASAAKVSGPALIYKQNCAACHNSGVAGAPKFKDKSAWKKRSAKGLDTLTKHVIEGYKAMPPMGGCSSCSKEDLKVTVQYLLDTAK